MLDIGWTELLAIAVLTIIVVGPKDLPKVLRTVGHWTAKARSITREFQNSLDDMTRQADLDDIKREIDATTYNNVGSLENVIDPTGTADRVVDLPETSTPSPAVEASDSPGVGEAVDGSTLPLADTDTDTTSAEIGADLPDQAAEEEPQRQVGS